MSGDRHVVSNGSVGAGPMLTVHGLAIARLGQSFLVLQRSEFVLTDAFRATFHSSFVHLGNFGVPQILLIESTSGDRYEIFGRFV